MKKRAFNVGMVLMLTLSMTSCYVNTFTVGSGPQTNQEVKKWNHYLIWGLAPIEVSNPNVLAGGAKDYEVTIKHTFVNGLLSAITWGLYSPTTTIVKK
jgi:hypothetical protein